jgi:predicted phage-related endonuclease
MNRHPSAYVKGGLMALDLELRRNYLGATDLVAISGLSDYKKPGDVWLEKMGKSTFTGNAATEWGTDLEPIVAMRHGRRFGVELLELPPEPIYHPVYHFIAANVDRIYKNRKRILECKTAGEDQLYEKDNPKWGEDGEPNKTPIGYLGQTNTYIGLLDFEDAYLSCMFLGKSRIQRDYPIDFDQELYDLMIQNGVAFWNTFIVPKIQPPVEMFTPDVVMKAVAMKARLEEKKAAVLVATPDLEQWVTTYRGLGQRIDDLTDAKKIQAAKIAQWIVENGGTKVKHSLGSFIFKKSEPKKPEQVFNSTDAWARLLASIPNLKTVPDPIVADLLHLAEDIRDACTTTTTSESAEPTLRPYWAK